MKNKKYYLKTTMVNKKLAKWLIKQKWLWVKSKIELVSYCSQDIDRRVEVVIGYKHLIFRGCIACEKFTQDKEYVIRKWMSEFKW